VDDHRIARFNSGIAIGGQGLAPGGILQFAGLHHFFRRLRGSGAGKDRLERQLLLAQPDQLRQVLCEHHGLDGFVDGVAGIVERLRADNLAGHAEEARTGGGRTFENFVRLVIRLPLAVGVGDFVPHLAGFGAEFGIALNGAADLAFEGGFARHQAVVA
jgi:hypothetical protein